MCADSCPEPQDAAGQQDPEYAGESLRGLRRVLHGLADSATATGAALVTDEVGNGSGGRLELGHDPCDPVMPVDVDGGFGRTMAEPVGDLA